MKHIYISSCDRDGGIYHYLFRDGTLEFCDKTPLDRPMYTVTYGGRLYVLLREIDESNHFGGVMSFEIAEDGSLCHPSEVVSTKGICPCHLTVTDDELYVVNYLSGNIVSTSGKESKHTGGGINLPRQDTAHTHYVNLSPDKKYLLCCDLGLDRIDTYDFDLNVVSSAKVPSGHGARHLAYASDGKYIYCANELGSTVSVFAYEDGALRLQSTYSSISETTKENTAAAIRYHDGCVYVSNRGEDTIVCFKATKDTLSFVSRTPTGGASPRDFDFCGDHLICTNENTNNITVFAVNGGVLVPTDEVTAVKNPLCVTVKGENS